MTTLPAYAVARLTRLNYVRFALDHETQTARAVNSGPHEAAHSSANGEWITGFIEPWAQVRRLGELSGLTLRLMGQPFNGDTVYTVVETTTT